MSAIEFIGKIVTLFKAYIGIVNEVKIRGNFSLIYQVGAFVLSHSQLLDEVADFGVPVITEPSIMSSVIQIPTMLNKVSNFVTKVAVGR